MEQARSNWNDDRLDQLSRKVDALEHRMDERFDALNVRFDSLHRTLVLTMTSILIAFATVIATQV